MLYQAVLILAISSVDTLLIDYELYQDVKYCQSTAKYINDYNKDSTNEKKVTSVCIEIDKNINI